MRASPIPSVATVLITMEPTESAQNQVVSNRVEVSSTSKDFVLSDNTDFTSTRILPPRQGLFLEKSVSSAKASPGDRLVYDLKITNYGSETQTSVQITDMLPSGLSLVSAIPGKGSCQSTLAGTQSQVECSVGTLADGESAAVVIETKIDQSTADTLLTNSANCHSTAVEVHQCRSQEAHTVVRPRGCADLSLTVDSPSEVPFSAEDPQDIVYTIDVNNPGPSRATRVRLSAMLPVDPLTGLTEVSFQSVEVIEGGFDTFCFGLPLLEGLTQQVECLLGNLDAGARSTVKIVLTPNAAIAGRVVSSTFRAVSGNDCDESDNFTNSLTRLHIDGEGPRKRSFHLQERPQSSTTGRSSDLFAHCS